MTEQKRTKADHILEIFETNPAGIKIAEVAAEVGCSVARVHEVIKASAGRIHKLGTGFYGTDANAVPPAVTTAKGKKVELTEEKREELIAKLERGVEFSVHGERGRFRVQKISTGPNGDRWVDAWGGPEGQEALRAFRLEKVRTVHRDKTIKQSPAEMRAPTRKGKR